MTPTDDSAPSELSVASTATTHRRTTYIWVIAVAIFVILIDQLSKSWAVDRLSDGSIIEIVWTLQFRLAYNTGMAFSAGAGAGVLIGVGALVVVGVLLWFAKDVTSLTHRILIGVVIGGALGNIVDRLLRSNPKGETGFLSGAVVDFIDLQWWPIFNVADAAIVVGGICLALTGLGLSDTGTDDEEGDTPSSDDGGGASEVAVPGALSSEESGAMEHG